MANREITNVKVCANGRTSVHWEIGEFKFHYWQADREDTPDAFTIYKNHSDEETSRRNPTKRLKANAAINRLIIAEVDRAIAEGDLFTKAAQAVAEKEAKKAAEDAERERVFDIARGTIKRLKQYAEDGETYYMAGTEAKALLMFMEDHGVRISEEHKTV